jgi:hypothetical protein
MAAAGVHPSLIASRFDRTMQAVTQHAHDLKIPLTWSPAKRGWRGFYRQA